VGLSPVISNARQRKWYVLASTLLTAVGLLTIGAAVMAFAPLGAAVVLLICVACLGIADGGTSIAEQSMMGRALAEEDRSAVAFTVTAIAGVTTIGIVLALHYLQEAETPLAAHVTMIWVAAWLLCLDMVLVALVREPADASLAGDTVSHRDGSGGFVQRIRRGMALAARVSWFRRFVVARIL